MILTKKDIAIAKFATFGIEMTKVLFVSSSRCASHGLKPPKDEYCLMATGNRFSVVDFHVCMICF